MTPRLLKNGRRYPKAAPGESTEAYVVAYFSENTLREPCAYAPQEHTLSEYDFIAQKCIPKGKAGVRHQDL